MLVHVSVCTETIFISAHEEEISAELQYLDCLTTFVKSFQLKCCSTYICLKTLFSICMAMLTYSLKNMEEILGDGPLHEERWTGTDICSMCEEEQEEHCQSPTK